MQKVVLPNGITVVYQHKPGNSAVVEVLVKVGSNHESPSERGISHFLEHILFEGTKTRPTNRDISNEIERIGGDFNAYTTSERTCFYVQVLRKHFPKAVEILADIFENSFFAEKSIEKEKKIVLKEIDMINDEPRFYQWLLFQKNLFIHHPCRYPTYGDSKVIRGLTRQKILDYFHKHYIPQNIVVSIVGDLPRWKREIQNKFNLAAHRPQSLSFTPERGVSKSITVREKRKIANTYTVLGFRTVPRSHPDSYVLDVINAIMGRGQSGKLFTEIRSKLGLAYDVGTQHVAEVSFGYFAAYATIDRKKITILKKRVLEEFQNLTKASLQDVQEAKDYIEGSYLLELEDTQKVADQLLFWENVRNAQDQNMYLKNIKKVALADIIRVVLHYFHSETFVIIEGK
ncbi:TPA: insulinase family protein [Candidatus Woesearchaeota archaeon]|nr:insulinase family protein [Candidatus Woesearchaeota archaeon]